MSGGFANINTEIGSVSTLTSTARYQSDPLAVYQALCGDLNNSLLLESAEIDNKQQTKSLLLTHAAVRIECNGHQVKLTSLSINGQSAIAFAHQALENDATCELNANVLTVTFEKAHAEVDELTRLKAANPFQVLRIFNQLNNESHHPLAVFLGGVFAFDLMAIAEDLPEVESGENTCPDYVYYLAENVIVIDHEKRTTDIISQVFSGPEQQKCYFEASRRIQQIKGTLSEAISATVESLKHTPTAVAPEVDISDQQFCDIVEQLKENIRAGDIFQVVPSRTFSIPCEKPLTTYALLKQSNPSPYMFFLKDQDFCLFGASPESALKYQQKSRQVELYPIAGTRQRGKNADGSIALDLDSRIELELRQDQKELAEHIMLVDLARNDIARVSQGGSRHVADLLKVDRYSHVMHLVSRVCGTLLPELDALHAYQACMNMGTLSGAPKVKATSLIRQVEQKRRGSYGGAVGYMTGEGEMDTCIVIRSAFVKDNTAHVQAGAGVVYDSVPQSEADETRQKAQAVIGALLQAQTTSLVSNLTFDKQEQ
ncbi:anthranilate synthase component 1 [Thalassotalea sp. LPB0316]|uniref:anthranilate synthase component 1 n=1 Tax=Thalassotalea sp. LPB0316 TaxID=2769490 RepID=UPI001868E220|nr:anthranilate synthase component 1 [Thalassotalea sp. LPB0316]QOL24678.1 anthranilate synthase component 1 [Thalassotalea sp. LPB0316]